MSVGNRGFFALLIFITLAAGILTSAPATELSLRQLTADSVHEFQNEQVKIRGFLYQKDDGAWILAAEPNLRSCCVGSAKKRESQVWVNLKHPPASPSLAAYDIEGTFRVQTVEGASRFCLDQAKISEGRAVPRGALALAGTGIALGGMFFWTLRKRRSR